MSLPQFLLTALIAYLIGSFSSGIFVATLKGRDIRKEGSKSSGATNVTRVLGPSYGLVTFLGDFAKSALALGAGYLIAGLNGALAASLFTVIGHNWPVYYQFKGGKGVVCSVAVVLLICPLEASIVGAITILIIWLTRYVSLGSLSFLALSALFLMVRRGMHPYGWWALILLALGLFQHRENIGRLLKGTENKLSFKKKTSA
ncbi:MAG: glycerol-3-phosphate 1-O-acyltransferase PlsY [Clostridiales bacterium]|nr:glycerol-3-phosphate 1-O-acyltransferase PlsY [Clostridiales bacterium]